MIRTVLNLTAENPGLDASGRLAVQVAVPMNEYPTTQDRARLYGSCIDRLEALPGVLRAGGVSPLPLAGGGRQRVISSDGFGSIDEGGLRVDHFAASPGYFATMDIPVVRGRDFRDSDAFGSRAVIVDETLAERLWPGADAVGRQFRLSTEGSPWLDVVGMQTWVFALWIVVETAVEAPTMIGTMRHELISRRAHAVAATLWRDRLGLGDLRGSRRRDDAHDRSRLAVASATRDARAPGVRAAGRLSRSRTSSRWAARAP